MTDVDMAPVAPEPAAPALAVPSDPTTMNGGDGRNQLWPPGSEMQIFSEKLCVLLTPNMSLKAPKGYAWVPEGDHDFVAEEWEERKRVKKNPARLHMPPPKSKKVSHKAPAARAPQIPVFEPVPEVSIDEMDFTGLTEDEIKAKKKEIKRRKKAQLQAQLAAVVDANTKLDQAALKATGTPTMSAHREEGKRPTKPVNRLVDNIARQAQSAAPGSGGKKTKKVAKRDKKGNVITHRVLKAQEIDAIRVLRHKALMKECREALGSVRKHKYAWIFNKAVDPIKDHIPDYFDIIKNPMDFGKIKEKLDKKSQQNGAYAGPQEFAEDMRLVFDNCETYNSPDSDAGLMGGTLRQEFERAWLAQNVEAKMAEEDALRAQEDAIIANTSDEPVEEEVLAESQQVSEVNRQLAEVQRQLEELKKQQSMAPPMGGGWGASTPPSGGGGGGGGGAKRKRMDDDDYFMEEEDYEEYVPAPRGGSRRGGGGGGGGSRSAPKSRAAPRATGGGGGGSAALPNRDMSYAEKQELTELLGELPEDKQARVVQIVAERHAEMGGAEDDLIEINIEELDSVTLWKLDRYVRSCLKPKKKKPTQADMLLEAQRLEAEAERELMQVEASLGVGQPIVPPGAMDAPAPTSAPASKAADGDATSSSSDSDSDSDSDSEDSAEGGGSNPKAGAAPAAVAAAAPAGGASTLVEVSSTARVNEDLALKQNASKKPVNVQNADGWANLADDVGSRAAAAAKPAADIPDSLWSEFETMAQQKTDREKEREQEEARELAESAAKEQAKLEEEERKVREVAEANAAAKRAEEEAEAAKKKALEEERARARAEIGGMAQTVDMAPEKVGSMMKEFEG